MTRLQSTSIAALIAMFAAAPALAQESNGGSGTGEDVVQGGSGTSGTGAQAAGGSGTGEPVQGQITMQSEDTVLADDLMGATVFNQNDEQVGDINDMIIGMDGMVQGIVIGVGGFLGIGEKLVALEMSSLSFEQGQDGQTRLVTSTTRDQLEQAPEFVSQEEQQQASGSGS